MEENEALPQLGRYQPLTMLLVTKNGQHKVLRDETEIQEAIIEHNITNFLVAEYTPLGKELFYTTPLAHMEPLSSVIKFLTEALGRRIKKTSTMSKPTSY